MPWLRSVAVWILLMVLESLHGTFRTLVLAPRIGDFPARRLSVLTGTALIFLMTMLTFRWLGVHSTRVLLCIGALWVALTVLFEISLGRLVFHFDWARVAADYDLSRGGLMGFGLVAMLFMPLLVASIRGRPTQSANNRWMGP